MLTNTLKLLVTAAVFTTVAVSSSNATVINHALNGTASQSSIYAPQIAASQADHAIDGNTSGVWSTNNTNNSLNHTAIEQGAWWEVDLGASLGIDSIVIWNRTDCCNSRLNNFSVYVDGSVVATYNQNLGPAPSYTISNLSQFGQIVRVQLNDTNYLHLAEVQVFGEVPEPASLGLLGLGLVGMGVMARRRRS